MTKKDALKIVKEIIPDDPSCSIVWFLIEHGKSRFADLLAGLVKTGKMAKLTLERKLRSLREKGWINREPGEFKGRPTFYYTLSPKLVDEAVDKARSVAFETIGRYIHAAKGLPAEERAKALEAFLRAMLSYLNACTLGAVLTGVEFRSKAEQFESYVLLRDAFALPAEAGILSFCSQSRELSKQLLKKILTEAGQEIRSFNTQLERLIKAPRRGGGEKADEGPHR